MDMMEKCYQISFVHSETYCMAALADAHLAEMLDCAEAPPSSDRVCGVFPRPLPRLWWTSPSHWGINTFCASTRGIRPRRRQAGRL